MDKSNDSIGSCSLDAVSTDFSDTSESNNFVSPSATREDFTIGMTERCRKVLQPLPLTPKFILSQPSQENSSSKSVKTTTTAIYDADGKTFITSMIKETDTRNVSGNFISAKSIDLQSPTVVAHANKKPSYLNLACCVNGYSNYMNYDSAERKEINKSREASPVPPFIVSSSTRQQRHNEVHSTPPMTTIRKESQNFRSSNVTKQFSDFNIHSGEKDTTDNIGRTPVEIKKSFIQQRVEKLYGTSNILTNNASNGTKHHITESIEKKSIITETSPSSSLPVMKHLRPEFANRLQFVTSPKSNTTISVNSHSNISELNNIKQVKEVTISPDENKNIQSSITVPPVVETNGSTKLKDESISIIQTNGKNNEIKDGHYFLRILNEEKSRILKMADETEEKLEKKQSEENANLSEEVVGIVLAAIGKARLLATKKFKQFEGLCNDNINPNIDAPVTLGDDLQGFWDMMMLQVVNVDTAFEEVEKCIQNDWKKQDLPAPQAPKGSRLVIKSNAKSKSNPKSQSNSEAAQKREEQRKKLIEMKKKQKAAIQNSENDLL